MLILVPDEFQAVISSIVNAHIEDWGFDPDDEEVSARVSALVSDLYKEFQDTLNSVEAEEIEEEEE